MTPNPTHHTDDIVSLPTQLSDPEHHLAVLDELVYDADTDGAVPLASDPDNRYPYAYPRDIACITRAWLAAAQSDVRSDASADRIVDAAKFMLAVQQDGRWKQRYSLSGESRAIYVQEDNVAHGIRVLSHAVLAATERERLDELSGEFLDRLVKALERALEVTTNDLYDPNAVLIESTTSIHEGRIESGYTLWVNSVFVGALRLAERALERLDAGKRLVDASELRAEIESFRSVLEGGVERSFAVDGMPVPRRYTPEGDRDNRPDVTLFAPYYYGLDDLFGEQTRRAAERSAAGLKDPELGGLQRFRGFYRDFEVHQHGGSGPWMQYTAWHAQFRFDNDEPDAGLDVLTSISQHVEDGYIPEHLSTRDRFEAFIDHEWDTGMDFKKEFDEEVLQDVSYDRIAEELEHMREAYAEMEAELESSEVISFAEPLAWCHAEFLVALLLEDGHDHPTARYHP